MTGGLHVEWSYQTTECTKAVSMGRTLPYYLKHVLKPLKGKQDNLQQQKELY